MGAEHKMTRRIQLRRDTGANWTSVDPVLSAGEIGVDLTTGQIKIGDGSSIWSELAYYSGSDVDLTGYATEEYVDSAIGALEIPSIEGLATESYVDDAIAAIPPGDGEVDLSGYATEEYVDDAINAIVIPDVSEFITAADIPTDFKGSVFADDSTTLVDAVNGKIVGEVDTLIGSIVNLESSNFGVETIYARNQFGVNIGAGGFNNLVVLENEVRIQNVPLNVDSNGLTFSDNTTQTTAYTGTANIARNIESESDVSIRVNLTDSTLRVWNFGTDGGLTFPDNTVQTTAYVPEGEISGYKGFKAHYGRLWGDDPTLSKIVIYKDTASPTSTIAADTDDDLFVVSGLGGSDIVALFVIAGSDDTSPVNVSVLKSFAEAVVDTVILVNGEEGNFRSIADMRAAFYDNIETLAAAAGSLYEDFEFYLTEFEVDGSTTVREGSGAEFTINNDGVDTYTVTAITAGGTNYLAGHKILVLGTSLGGESPANDAVITVTGISDGLIDTVSITGTAAAAGLGLFAEVTGTNYEVGSGLVVIQVGTNIFDEEFVNTSNSGSGYVVGDVITVPGDTIQGGTSPANDIIITVTSVDGSGAETGFTFAGTFPTEVWPPNFIRDGGDDQYDDGNFIDTNLANEISYNDGEIVTDSETEFGSGSSYVVVYENSIFGVLATGADITSLGTSGETGADGDGSTDTGSLYGDTGISLGNFVFIGDKMTTTGSDLYVQSPDDLYLDALGDDVLVRAKDDIRLRTGYNFQNNEYNWQFRFTDGGSQIFFNGAEEEDYGRITPNLFDEGVRGLTLEGENQIRLRVDNSGNELILNSDGELIFSDNTIQTTAWAGGRVVAAPGASTGAAGDKAGDLAFDSQYIYYCTVDYTDGIENIWKRVAWSNDTWGG